ncbi:MAG: ATP-binding cassette domain-containing protein, partial [Taibaiella sp.]|nr:ATP-binding cassette domain-containing protein [Taibaiella sp.]
ISFVFGGAISTSVILLIALVVFGAFIYGYFQVSQMKIIEKIEQQLYVRYAFQYAYTLPRLDIKATENYYRPELMNRYFDIMILQKGISKLLLDVPTATIQILAGLLLLTLYHPLFIFFGILVILVIVLILYFSGNRGVETSLEESKHKYKMAAHLEQVALNVVDYKFYKEDFNLGMADKNITAYLKSRTNHFKVLLLQYWSLVYLKVFIIAAMLIAGAVLLFGQQLNIGQFIAAEIIIILVINSVEKLIINLEQVYDVITAVEKINEVTTLPLEAEEQTMFEPDAKQGVHVEVNKLSFSYEERGQNVMSDISVNVLPGERLLISGESGSGKSTMLKLVAGIFKPGKGSVLINGLPIHKYSLLSLRNNTGILLQSSGLFDGTLMENILCGRDIPYSTISRLAEITGLKKFVEEHKDGYDMRIYPGKYDLQDETVNRILLVRALVAQSKLLLLDYPSSCGEEVTKNVLEYIDHEMKGTTVIIISEQQRVEAWCDKKLVL